MVFRPSRRFLLLPAWTWFWFPPLLVLFAYLLGRPGDLPEPKDRDELFRPPVIVAREGDSFRFLPWDDPQGIWPLWAVNCTITSINETTWSLGVSIQADFGFWKRSGKWRYALSANRFDKNWKSGEPVLLPIEDVVRLRPLVIEDLNRRSPNERRGDRLAELLDHGLERTSFVCAQNALLLLAWLSLPVALLGFVAMFIERPKHAAAPDLQS
jgi:hypothetical protein